MNIAFFLLPKSEIIYLNEKATLRQALERMEYHSYSAVPVVDDEGRYVNTLTEGDILWKMKNTSGLTFDTAHQFFIRDIERQREIKPVYINADMIDLIELSKVQNFVPVVDDHGVFIGMVRRSEIINYCFDRIK